MMRIAKLDYHILYKMVVKKIWEIEFTKAQRDALESLNYRLWYNEFPGTDGTNFFTRLFAEFPKLSRDHFWRKMAPNAGDYISLNPEIFTILALYVDVQIPADAPPAFVNDEIKKAKLLYDEFKRIYGSGKNIDIQDSKDTFEYETVHFIINTEGRDDPFNNLLQFQKEILAIRKERLNEDYLQQFVLEYFNYLNIKDWKSAFNCWKPVTNDLYDRRKNKYFENREDFFEYYRDVGFIYDVHFLQLNISSRGILGSISTGMALDTYIGKLLMIYKLDYFSSIRVSDELKDATSFEFVELICLLEGTNWEISEIKYYQTGKKYLKGDIFSIK
jgi:hypothetical protein